MYNLIQQLPGVIYEFTIRQDGTKAFTFISSNCIDILGVSAEDAMLNYKTLEAVIYSEDQNNFAASASASFHKKNLWVWEGRVDVRNEIRWIEVRSNYEANG
jgi:hypothetical protein